jgi:uncharacterized membrane-anchored protein
MTIEELNIIMYALLQSNWIYKDKAIKLIEREIRLKTLDPRNGRRLM